MLHLQNRSIPKPENLSEIPAIQHAVAVSDQPKRFSVAETYEAADLYMQIGGFRGVASDSSDVEIARRVVGRLGQ
jgi:hypothetical protein